MHVHVSRGFSFYPKTELYRIVNMKKKIMEIYVHFIYNVVQIKEHIDQYFHTYFIRFELNKYLFF